MIKTRLSFFIVFISIWIMDQITKLLVVRHIPLYGQAIEITPFLRIIHIKNTGIAFGLWAGGGWTKQLFFIGFSLLAILAILYYLFKTGPSLLNNLGCGLVIGGALGNLTDRILHGNVVDFIDCHFRSYHWPAFNIADSAVTIGMFILAITILLKESH